MKLQVAQTKWKAYISTIELYLPAPMIRWAEAFWEAVLSAW